MRALLPIVARRTGAARERHGRGVRGPLALPGPLNSGGVKLHRTHREEFDDLVLTLVDRHLTRWEAELGDVEFGTEDVPQIPADWSDEPLPFGALTRARPGQPARIVVFRRPVELRANSRLERVALVNEILIEHIADLLGRDPDEIDP
ncbi:MAG: metallopeptidase family protein [Nocardioidaceae bacterium]